MHCETSAPKKLESDNAGHKVLRIYYSKRNNHIGITNLVELVKILA